MKGCVSGQAGSEERGPDCKALNATHRVRPQNLLSQGFADEESKKFEVQESLRN